jgi:hypothetical protein
MSADEWIECLRHQTVEDTVQPWRQLAAVYAAAGQEREARKILIAEQDNHREQVKARTASTRCEWLKLFAQRSLLWVSRRATGYGYQSWRAAVWLVVVVMLSMTLAFGAGYVSASGGGAWVHVAGHTASTREEGTPCSATERLALGLQIGLPLVKVPASDRCGLNSTSASGQGLTLISWMLQLAAWALATLAVAGYTGLIRRV